jgi:dTMP kinase
MNSKLKENKGKIIVIEGIDCSGKATQVKMAFEELIGEKYRAMRLEFPNYKSDSSALIKMYLNGEFGEDPQSVNPYGASLFFAADRFASFKSYWEKFYNEGGILILDRYVSSNMIYQAAKIENSKEREEYLDWIYDLEFKKLNLPKPDIVIFLRMPPSFCMLLNDKRLNKIDGSGKKDIHERDTGYLEKTYEVAVYAAKKYKWAVVDCIENNSIKSVKEINGEILRIIENLLNGEKKF